MILISNLTRAALIAALLAITGCFSLSREEPPMQHYVLGGASQMEEQSSQGEATGITVGLRQIQLADYLDTPFVVIRRGSHRVTYSDFHRWGEPLAGGISRSIARYLLVHQEVRAVDVAPWTAGTQHDYLVEVHVTRFEGRAPDDPPAATGEVHMAATWQIRQPLTAEVLARGSTSSRHPNWDVGDYDGLVEALEQGLRTLAENVLTELETLGPASQ